MCKTYKSADKYECPLPIGQLLHYSRFPQTLFNRPTGILNKIAVAVYIHLWYREERHTFGIDTVLYFQTFIEIQLITLLR